MQRCIFQERGEGGEKLDTIITLSDMLYLVLFMFF